MKRLIIGLAAIAVLGACSNVTKEKLGLAKKAPNEFMVTTRPPLSLPPEYDLRPVAAPAVDEEKLPAADEAFIAKLGENR